MIKDQTTKLIVGVIAILVLTRHWVTGDMATWTAEAVRWKQGPEAFSSSIGAVLDALASGIYLVSTVLAVRWSGVIDAGIKLFKTFVGYRRSAGLLPMVESTDGNLIGQLQENIEILQGQIDAMKAETSWAAARKSGV